MFPGVFWQTVEIALKVREFLDKGSDEKLFIEAKERYKSNKTRGHLQYEIRIFFVVPSHESEI